MGNVVLDQLWSSLIFRSIWVCNQSDNESNVETFGAGKPPASHSKITSSPSAAVWLSGSFENNIISVTWRGIRQRLFLMDFFLLMIPWWSRARHGQPSWSNKTSQFRLRSMPRTCNPPRPHSPRALSQASFRNYHTLSDPAVTLRLFSSIVSLAGESLRRCTKAETFQYLCQWLWSKVNLALVWFCDKQVSIIWNVCYHGGSWLFPPDSNVILSSHVLLGRLHNHHHHPQPLSTM